MGLLVGEPVAVTLTNGTGHVKTYHWAATQNNTLVSLGEETLGGGRTATILVPTSRAVTGTMRIALTGTDIFITVPMQKL